MRQLRKLTALPKLVPEQLSSIHPDRTRLRWETIAMSQNADERLKLFFIYSRNDLPFVDQIAPALDAAGFDTFVDRAAVVGGEDWRQRLTPIIQGADSIVFILSPDSATSQICEWELAEAHQLGKWVVPVICRALGATEIPSPLSRPNRIPFYDDNTLPGSGFATGISALIRVLRTESKWIRNHTRLGDRARRWSEEGRSTDFLLNKDEIGAAKQWLSQKPGEAPEPSELQRAYIAASEEAATARIAKEHRPLADVASIRTLGPEELEQLAIELEDKRRALADWESLLAERQAALKKFDGATASNVSTRSAPKRRGTKVFISYRRSSCLHICGRMYDRLEREFTRAEIFFDVDAIPVGTDFKRHISGSIEQSAVLLAVIGSDWVNPAWIRDGLWRAAAPTEDFVQTELELAFQSAVPITPILIDQTPMPERRSLPHSIVGLCDLNAAFVRGGRDFHADMNIVCDKIRAVRSQV